MNKHPEISVVVPAHNEEGYIANTLLSLKKQDFPLPYEIIVVDNASDDQTAEIAEGLCIKVIKEPHIGLSWAREKGFSESKAEILAYIDADSIAPGNWLSVIYKTFQENREIAGVSGMVYFYDGHSTIICRDNIIRLLIEGDRRIRKFLRRGELLWGANFAVRKSTLKEAGGFNKNIKFYGEDTNLGIRLSSIGRLKFNTDMIVYTSARRFKKGGVVNSMLHLQGYFKELLLPTPVCTVNYKRRFSKFFPLRGRPKKK